MIFEIISYFVYKEKVMSNNGEKSPNADGCSIKKNKDETTPIEGSLANVKLRKKDENNSSSTTSSRQGVIFDANTNLSGVMPSSSGSSELKTAIKDSLANVKMRKKAENNSSSTKGSRHTMVASSSGTKSSSSVDKNFKVGSNATTTSTSDESVEADKSLFPEKPASETKENES